MHDIRQLLDTAKGEVPPPRYGVDDIVVAAHRRRRWVAAGRIGGAGIAAVAVVTAMVLVGGSQGLSRHQTIPGPDSAAGPALPTMAIPPLTFMFGPYRVGALDVLPPEVVTTTYQSTWISTDYRDAAGQTQTAFLGTLTVYRPGIRPPAEFTYGTKVSVHGLPGIADEREQDLDTIENGETIFANPHPITANTLAWQYAANSWAVIDSIIELPTDASRRMTAADELAVADHFSFGAPSRARMPFQVGYLPAGWQVVSVSGRNFTDSNVGIINIIFAPASAAGTDQIRHFTNDGRDGPAVVITIGRQQSTPVPDAPKKKNTCGHLETNTDLWCSWDIPKTNYFLVLHDPASTLSSAELIKIGQGLVFDNIDKPSTWHPVP